MVQLGKERWDLLSIVVEGAKDHRFFFLPVH